MNKEQENKGTSLKCQNQQIKYKNYTFIDKIEFSPLQEERISQIFFNGESILLINREEIKQKCSEIFVNIIECELKQFDYRSNNNPNILKQISSIYFKELKTLFLHSNNINSIEPLSFLSCQNLEDLALDNNKIIRITSLKKWANSNFSWFALAQNPINQISSISKMTFDRTKLTNLRLFFQYENTNQNTISQDLSIYIKTNIDNISYIQYYKEGRIQQKKILKIIKRDILQ